MSDSLPTIVEKVRMRTPARLLAGRSGGSYRTSMQLDLRSAHAASRDAVRTEFDLLQHLGRELIERFGIFEVSTIVRSKNEYLLRPDLGRRFSPDVKALISERCSSERDLQVCVGDGL